MNLLSPYIEVTGCQVAPHGRRLFQCNIQKYFSFTVTRHMYATVTEPFPAMRHFSGYSLANVG